MRKKLLHCHALRFAQRIFVYTASRSRLTKIANAYLGGGSIP